MRNLKHSNNICTVGWTNIWAQMTSDDIQWLLKKIPEGYLTPTFYDQILRPNHNNEHILKYVKDYERYFGRDTPRGFYFQFELNQQGIALLVSLTMKGMKLHENFQTNLHRANQ